MHAAQLPPPPMGSAAAAARLPLWEAVVLAGALRALAWRGRVAYWSPAAPFPHATCAGLLASLPAPPSNLAARAAVLRFRPGTLRAHLAADAALQQEVRQAVAVAAVPLWLKVLVAPLAACYLLYALGVWCASEGVTLALGWGLMLCGEASHTLFAGAALLQRYLLLPLYWACVYPLAWGGYHFVLVPCTLV